MVLGTCNSQYVAKKAGVSLVTVLLFMLVATIAATATFKWLTSENRSSSARMQKQEAYQSAMAGIENTRAWMTFHANDVGAMIRQYQETGKKIKLNDRLVPWLKAGQNYDVWLTGVNTGSAHNIKLKILSSGTASGGSKHNEIAIFNVDGLYQVRIPQVVAAINFNKAFQGESDKFVGTDKLESGIVNGDFKGNQPAVEKEFLVTGSIEYEGAASMKGDLYVGKDLKNKGATTIGNQVQRNSVVYVGRNLTYCDGGLMTVYGDMYVGGNISDNCSIHVTGNLTIGGKLVRNSATRKFTVEKNLVFKETGAIDWTGGTGLGDGSPVPTDTKGTGVGENTYLANIIGQDQDGNRKANLGKKLYLYQAFPYSHCFNETCASGYCEGFFNATCGSNDIGAKANRFFSFYNPQKPTSRISSLKVGTWSRDDDVLKNVGFNYWTNIDKMNNYGKQIKDNGKVPTAILLKDESVWTRMAYSCNLSRSGFADNVIDQINNCYTTAETNNALYNGFLILDLNFTETVDPEKSLKGKFVFIMRGNSQLALPSTTRESIVMLYFPNGHSNDIMPGQPAGCVGMGAARRCDPYNYFIYSKGSIKQFLDWGNRSIEGSVILASGKLQTSQGGTNLKYNATVVNALAAAGFIMENPEYTALIQGDAVAIGDAAAGAKDAYLIANSPQLQVSLETQYQNNEPLPEDADQQSLTPSFMILPRIIYIPKNPYGRLTDYFNVVNLNGAALVKDAAKVTDCADIPKASLLYDRANEGAQTLPQGLHTCNYTDNNQTVPFYVFVSPDELGDKPFVYFENPSSQPMGSNSTEYLTLVYPSSATADEFTVKIGKTNDLNAETWSVTPLVATEGACDASSSECTFKLHFDGNSPLQLFEVKTNGATEGSCGFQILECTGCQIGDPNYKNFVISSSINIQRENLATYCARSDVTCDEDLQNMANTTNWPDCQVSDNAPSWVKAVGVDGDATNNCSVTSPNNFWICGLSSDIKLMEVSSGVPEGCFAVIPSQNNLLPQSSLANGATEKLYASLKAKKVNFHLEFKGDNLTGKTISVSSSRFSVDRECVYTTTNKSCNFELFAGDDITFTVDGGKADFSYWKCDPATSVNCHETGPTPGESYTVNAVSGDNSIEAWYGQNDKHCFFDEFKYSKNCPAATSAKGYCFDYCKDAGQASCRIGNGNYADSKWIVIGDASAQGKINFEAGENGFISMTDSYLRGRNQSAVEPIVVMSTVNAGLYGTLRAQFQAPRMGRDGDESSIRVNKTGFLLRSSDNGEQALILNVYVDRSGYLTAKVCVEASCEEQRLTNTLGSGLRIDVTDVVTLSADLLKEEYGDVLNLTSVKGNFGTYSTVTAQFELSSLTGYSTLSTRANEFVGLSLADPSFKLFDVGWKSFDYNAECWEHYPTVKCSFKDAFLGGIVPANTPTRPWVGLSGWFDDKNCTPQYMYNGDDATAGCYTSISGSDYKVCNPDNYYKFTAEGIHGTVSGDVESRMARVSVNECSNAYLTQENRDLLALEKPSCGMFWVGTVHNCSENITLFPTTSGVTRTIPTHTGGLGETEISEDEIFLLSGSSTANLRAASLRITMDNSDASELEIYLRSDMKTGYYGTDGVMFSKSAHSTAKNTVTINVAELANNSGFDVENVNAVIIRNLGQNNVTISEIRSVCDYVTNIQCKDVEYTGGKFKVNAVVKNAEGNVTTYQISATENLTNNSSLTKTFTCANSNECPAGDEVGRIALWTNEFNPYASTFTDSKKYVFEVAMKKGTEHVEGSPCTTPEIELFPISGECRWGNGENEISVQQGTGLPSFQYRLAECPTGTCEWQVLLDGEAANELASGSGAAGGFSNLPIAVLNQYNTSASPLSTTSPHTITFLSKNSSTTKFTQCTKTFNVTEVTNSSSSDGAMTCTFPAEVLPGKQHLNIAISSSLPHQQFDLYIDGVKKSAGWWFSGTGNSPGITSPTGTGNHTYKVTKMGEAAAQCQGSFATVGALQCSISGNQFVVSKKSFVGNCYNCSYSNVNCGGQCANGLHNYPYTSANNPSVSCTCDEISSTCSAQPDIPAPTLSCSGTYTVAPLANVTVDVEITGCASGCTYWVTNPQGTKITPATDGTITNASTITFASENGTSTNTYKIHVKNSKAEKECSFDVAYSEATSSASVVTSSATIVQSSSTPRCGCTCDDCTNIELRATESNEYTAFSHCFFVDDGNTKFRIDNPCSSVKINGTTINGKHSETELKNYGVSAVDGGYYIEIIHEGSPDNNRVYCNYNIYHTSASNPCQ